MRDFLNRHLDFDKLKEEVRKIGSIMVGAGALALALENPKNPIAPEEAIIVILIGIVLVVFGSLQSLEANAGG